MTRYSAKVVIDYDGKVSVDTKTKMTKSKENEMLRDVVWLQISDALRLYGLQTEVLEVRKVRDGKDTIDA